MTLQACSRGEVLPAIPDQILWSVMTSVEEVELEILQIFEDGRRGPQKYLDALKGIVNLTVMNTTYAGEGALDDILERAEMEDFKDKPGEFQLLLVEIQEQFRPFNDDVSKTLVKKVNSMRSEVRPL
jgi:hypothetical protein